jgi:tetratricopeptide (TPR) repeat protein
VNHHKRIFVGLSLGLALLVPVAFAQKPSPSPSPSPTPPPSTNNGRPPASTPNTQPEQPLSEERVMFLLGNVASNDGTALPNDVRIERICDSKIRQQVFATSRGDFSMQLGSMADSYLDASGERAARDTTARRIENTGIPRRELTNCELRASASGFRSNIISLIDRNTFGSSVDVGSIVVQRATKVEGMTLSATPYRAPKDALKAYEKGMEFARKSKFADAEKYFNQAVGLYPKYADAWFELGAVLQKQNQKDGARTAYLQATTINNKFLPPYVSLATMAFAIGNWPEVLQFTDHILELDPLNKTKVTGYIVDLDPWNSAEAYFYNAFANYKLGNVEAAEKSALKAEHVDLRTSFPQLHLLLGEIHARKNDYAAAIPEIRKYLELAPHAPDADQVRGKLAEMEKLSGPVPDGKQEKE